MRALCDCLSPCIVLGFTSSQLTVDMGFTGSDTAEASARTPAWAALSDDVKGMTGKWMVREKVVSCEWQADVESQQKLWDYVEQLP